MNSLAAYWSTYIFLPAKSMSTKGFPLSIILLKFKLLYYCYLLLFIEIDTSMYTCVWGRALSALLSILISSLATTIKVMALFTLRFNILPLLVIMENSQNFILFYLVSCLYFNVIFCNRRGRLKY